jgi:hypothetical protein
VAAAGRDHQGALGELLAAHVAEVQLVAVQPGEQLVDAGADRLGGQLAREEADRHAAASGDDGQGLTRQEGRFELRSPQAGGDEGQRGRLTHHAATSRAAAGGQVALGTAHPPVAVAVRNDPARGGRPPGQIPPPRRQRERAARDQVHPVAHRRPSLHESAGHARRSVSSAKPCCWVVGPVLVGSAATPLYLGAASCPQGSPGGTQAKGRSSKRLLNSFFKNRFCSRSSP